MTDRVIVYDGALFQTTDILNTNKFAMVGQAFQNAATLGTSTVVAGLSCVPTGPASLQVVVNEGSIYQMDEADATAYGDLGTDTNTIMKQGILYAPKTLTITPPSTSGFSQVFLVEAELSDIDAGSTVLSYYNSTPPNVPFSGPAGVPVSQNTTRTCVCTISLKAGTAATTGTQTTPAPDAGFVGLYAITVPNGATQITSGMIVQLASAPFFPTLPAVPGDVQGGTWVGFDDTGSANAYVITPQPAITAYAKYQKFRVKIANQNTGASTLNVNGLGAKSIVMTNGSPLPASALAAGMIAEFIYNGTSFELISTALNSAFAGLTASQLFTVILASTTYTIQSSTIKITAVGGGGGGTNTAGGGGGSTFIGYLTGLTIGDTLTVTIGGGGTGSTSGVATAGGNSAISSGTQTITTMTAGSGGGASGSTPGVGGVATNGQINSAGNGGSTAPIGGIAQPYGPFGDGGSTQLNGVVINAVTIAGNNGAQGIMTIEAVG